MYLKSSEIRTIRMHLLSANWMYQNSWNFTKNGVKCLWINVYNRGFKLRYRTQVGSSLLQIIGSDSWFRDIVGKKNLWTSSTNFLKNPKILAISHINGHRWRVVPLFFVDPPPGSNFSDPPANLYVHSLYPWPGRELIGVLNILRFVLFMLLKKK